MGTTTIRGMLVVGLAALLLAGCASTQQAEEEPGMEPATEEPAPMETPEEPTPPPMQEAPKPMVNSMGKLVYPTMGMETEVLPGLFYFDFDQAIIKRAGLAELDKHAKALSEDRMLRARLEGHADERGTREYNLALGERRANAVKAYLVAQGASPSQLEVISYGEEKPAMEGHNEEAWAMNRRVEIVYR
jgi:peptidoglycan-associated lipoprotein